MTNTSGRYASSNSILFLESLWVIVLIFGFTAFFLLTQENITVGEGFGWDGVSYKDIYLYFATSSPLNPTYPFCNRIATPYLASLFSNEYSILDSFKLVNLFFGTIFSALTYLCTRKYGFNTYYATLSLFLSAALLFSPIRFTNFYPAYTDPAFLALLTLSILAILHKRYVLALIPLVIAYPFREASIYILVPLSLCMLYLNGPTKKLLLSIFIAFFLTLLMKYSIGEYADCHGVSPLWTAIGWTIAKLSPIKFIGYIAAISMVAAPLYFLNSSHIENKLDIVFLIGLVIALALAFVGGSDSTRIFYSFFPLYFLLIIKVVASKGIIFSIFCSLGYVTTNSILQKILQPVSDWPKRDELGFFFQFPDHARPEVSLMILAIWGIIFIFYHKFENDSMLKHRSEL